VKALLVVNPRAGRVRGEAGVARVERRLVRAGLEVQRLEPAAPEETAAALGSALRRESPRHARVVVAGGDGSINSVLPAVMGTEFPLAILPVGSVNVLARELGIPRGLQAAAAVAASGQPLRIDLGLANGRPFALMAGIGFDAAVVHTVAPDVKNVVGSFAYVARGLKLLAGQTSSRFRIATEEGSLEAEAWLAVVANASRYTYRWRLAPAARIDDGWLDLCLFQGSSAAQAAGQVVAALAGRHAGYPGVSHLRARRLRFECDPPVCVQVDGDPAGETPVEIDMAPGALSVLVPAAE
jgi:YegS/Rv2252/BmrU family lipid kinase